jgi:hypothetical protein
LAGTEASTIWRPLAPGLKTSMLLSASGMNWFRLKRTFRVVWFHKQKYSTYIPSKIQLIVYVCMYECRGIFKCYRQTDFIVNCIKYLSSSTM